MLMRPDEYAVITGATSGIGLEFARRFASGGMRLMITGRRAELLRQRADELQALGAPSVELVTGDLADAAVVSEIELFLKTHACSVLVNNAGFGTTGRVDELETSQLLAMAEVLMTVPLRLCRAVIPSMRERRAGVVINVGSLAGNVAVPKAATYVSSKAFIERLSESLALENLEAGVVVQALTPGFVKTDFHRDVSDYRSRQQSRGMIRWLTPEEVVDLSLSRAEEATRKLQNGFRVPSRRLTVVVPGFWNRFLFAASRFVPRRIAYRGALNRARL